MGYNLGNKLVLLSQDDGCFLEFLDLHEVLDQVDGRVVSYKLTPLNAVILNVSHLDDLLRPQKMC